MEPVDDIPIRANRALHLILIAFMLIALKVALLTLVKREHWQEIARKPTMRTVITPAERGMIRDRFGVPLAEGAINRVVAITYDPIREVPRVRYERSSDGKKIKRYVRKEFIEHLSGLLADHLSLEAQWIEDLIYSKASLFPNTPFPIKGDLDEKLFARLKMMEKDLPGLTMLIETKRHYPLQGVGSGIIGFVGPIHQERYLDVHNEMARLVGALDARDCGEAPILPAGFASWKEVRARLDELTEMSYSLNTVTGKTGIEAKFDEELRGKCGKLFYEVDTMGRHLRKLPDSRPSTPGAHINLTISSELQEHATKLLGVTEKRREERFRMAGKRHGAAASPWIKGGAIVAMDPHTGEIVCLATYPEFNHCDFLPDSPNRQNIHQWLETEMHIGHIWDGQIPLERQWFDLITNRWNKDVSLLTWKTYIERILSAQGATRHRLLQVRELHEAIYLQNTFDMLLALSPDASPKSVINALYPETQGHTACKAPLTTLEIDEKLLTELRQPLDALFQGINYNYDKLLLLDLLRLAVPAHLFSDPLSETLRETSIDQFRKQTRLFQEIKRDLIAHLRTYFHSSIFHDWRKIHFADYLKEKREEEKAAKRFNKPYLDYLEAKETELFSQFLDEHQLPILLALIRGEAHPLLSGFTTPKLDQFTAQCPKIFLDEYLRTLRAFNELDRPIYATTPRLQTERDLAASFYPRAGYSYMKSHCFQESAPLGSIFKLVTAYEAVNQVYHREGKLNPLTIIDSPQRETIANKGAIMGYTVNKKPITRHYKGGRLPRSFHECGKIELEEAFEASSNIYYSLLASEVIDHPNDLAATTKALSFGSKTGIDLPGEVSGNIPDDLADNKTGLYAFAIGQHSLTVTPLQTAIMLSALATNGEVLKPQIVHSINFPQTTQDTSNPLSDYPKKLGIDFPLFLALDSENLGPKSFKPPRQIKDRVDLPMPVQRRLIEALSRVVHGKRGSARVNAIASLYAYPNWRTTYQSVHPTLVGKTATAEILYRPCLDREFSSIMAKHIWFGGISYEDIQLTKPELVVVVYLRYGDYGKEAAPLAAEIIAKWREIQRRHAQKGLAAQNFPHGSSK